MAAKRKPTKVTRAIPPLYRPGAVELAATAGDKYRVDGDGPTIDDPIAGKIFWGPMVPGIRGPDGRFDARPGMDKIALYDEVAQLNAGLPGPPKSQVNKSRKPRYATEAVRWVEILFNVPETRALLLAAEGGKLSTDEVRELMTYRDDQRRLDISKVFPLPTEKVAERNLIKAVSKHLERYHGIGRGMDYDTGIGLNGAKQTKRKAAATVRRLKGIDAEHDKWMEAGKAKKSRT